MSMTAPWFDNTAPGQFVLPTGLDVLGLNGSYGTLSNEGTLLSTGGTGTSVIQVPLINDGAVTVQSGTLLLQGSGSDRSTEPMEPFLDATLDFNSNFSANPFVIAAGSTGIISGGTVSFSGGTVDDSGGYNVTNTVITGGTLLIEGTGTTGVLAPAPARLEARALSQSPARRLGPGEPWRAQARRLPMAG